MSIRILTGDALTMLRTLADESVQCCITSPPYWGLRDYGTAKWSGGLLDCKHTRTITASKDKRASVSGSGNGGVFGAATFTGSQNFFRETCAKCGAVRIDAQLGLERTPEEYVARMVEAFREVRRVLRSDGTCWINIGDCYATGAGKVGDCPGGGAQGDAWRGSRNGHEGKHAYSETARGTGALTQPNRMPLPGLKPKDLVGIPWMLAFALRADGWYLRSEIIWHKPNPMPESVTDRPTKAHEQIFLLAKSERYWYDAGAIKEPASADTHARYARGRSDTHKWANGGPGNQTIATNKPGSLFARKSAAPGSGIKNNTSFDAAMAVMPDARNKRTVWTVTTQATPEAHFATYPIALIEPCILAGCPAGGVVLDPFCGAGTTGMAALKHGREFIGIELNPAYVEIARSRLMAKMPLLAQDIEMPAGASENTTGPLS